MEYKEAFQMMRRQKVDLNFILDLDIWKFLDTGQRFIESGSY
jgi:hypothetical protein